MLEISHFAVNILQYKVFYEVLQYYFKYNNDLGNFHCYLLQLLEDNTVLGGARVGAVLVLGVVKMVLKGGGGRGQGGRHAKRLGGLL